MVETPEKITSKDAHVFKRVRDHEGWEFREEEDAGVVYRRWKIPERPKGISLVRVERDGRVRWNVYWTTWHPRYDIAHVGSFKTRKEAMETAIEEMKDYEKKGLLDALFG